MTVSCSSKQLDMELIPLEFRVVAWFRIRIEISFKIFRKRIRIVIFDKTWSKLVWQWRASGYRGTVWKKEGRKDDLGPPQFPYCDRVDDQWYVNPFHMFRCTHSLVLSVTASHVCMPTRHICLFPTFLFVFSMS